MKRILVLSFVLLIISTSSHAQFSGGGPFGRKPFLDGAFGRNPFNTPSGGGGGGIPSGAIQDDSGHYLQDDAAHYLISG